MGIGDLLAEITIGVIASLVAAGLIWYFRRQIREAIAGLDISAGAVLGWVLLYLLVVIVFVLALLDKEIPLTILFLAGALVFPLVWNTATMRRK